MAPKYPSTGPSGGQTSRFKVRGREVEHRRMRGEASCAECRRCKLKCDKRIPCSSCVRRGCQAICPNGSASNANGSRIVFSSTDTMHRKLQDMSQRIRQLEDTVQIMQGMQSNNPHPLLDEQFLQIKSFDIDDGAGQDAKENAELSDAFGTLTISDKGEVRFIGKLSSEVLFMNNEIRPITVSSEPDTSGPLTFKPGAAHEGLERAEVLRGIEARVPTYQRATTLLESYLGYIAWHSRLVRRDQIFEEILPTIYRRGTTGVGGRDVRGGGGSGPGMAQGGDCNNTLYVHRLALFFALLACGATVHLALPANSAEAARYDTLARTCLSLRSVFQGTTLESVQTIIVLASYQFFTLPSLTFEPAWKTMIFGLTLGLSIGLHRDPSRWEMDLKHQERRRTCFWELFSMDKWKSLETGRPSVFNLAETDCELPRDDAGGVAADGTFRPSYWRWKQTFARDVIGPVAEFMALAKPVKYSHVLELDRRVREFNSKPVPAELQGPPTDTDIIIRRSTAGIYREMVLLALHRNFFARAMLEDAENALSGPYSASVLAAYACSISYLKLVKTQYVLQSPLLIRQWFLWIHALIAGVIVGTVAIKGPTPAAIRAAQNELQMAIELFEYADVHPVCRSGLKILHRLLDKSRYRSQFTVPPDASGLNSGGPTQGLYTDDGRSADADEELRILGGGARTINVPSRPSASSTTTSSTDSPASTSTGSALSPNSLSSPPTSPEQSRQQQKQTTTRRESGLFAIGASELSVFYAPNNDTGNGFEAPPPGTLDGRGAFDGGRVNPPATNFDIGVGTGVDSNSNMFTGPSEPLGSSEQQTNDWRATLESMGIPPLTPQTQTQVSDDQLELLSSFCDPSDMAAIQGLFEGVSLDLFSVGGNSDNNGNAGDAIIGGGFAGGAGTIADAGSVLGMDSGTFQASNTSFDFLIDDMLSSGGRSSGSGSSERGPVQSGQSNGTEQENADAAAAWHSLLGEMQALQRSSDPTQSVFTQDLPVFG